MALASTGLDEALPAARPIVPAVGFGRNVQRRFRRNRLAVAGLVTVSLLGVVALAAPWLSDFGVIGDPYDLALQNPNAGWTWEHPLGTDYLGRDILARTIYGARISLSLGLLIQLALVVVGGAVGLTAGYVGGRVDNALMRITDAAFAFPDLIFVLVIASVLGPGYWNLVIAAAVVNWVFLARLVRGEVLTIKEQDYIAAARATGSRPLKILRRHLFPNVLGPVLVAVTFGIPSAIFLEAFLSFIGVGLRPPTPSWGVMINEGYQAVFAYPHQILPSAVAISLTVLSFNFIGDGLRDAFDVRGGEGR